MDLFHLNMARQLDFWEWFHCNHFISHCNLCYLGLRFWVAITSNVSIMSWLRVRKWLVSKTGGIAIPNLYWYGCHCITQNHPFLLLGWCGKVRNTDTYDHMIWSISYRRHMLYILSCYILWGKNLTRIEINYVHIFEVVESFSFLDSHCDNCNIQEQLRQCST